MKVLMAKQLKTIKYEEKEKRKGKTTTKRKEKKKNADNFTFLAIN